MQLNTLIQMSLQAFINLTQRIQLKLEARAAACCSLARSTDLSQQLNIFRLITQASQLPSDQSERTKKNTN